MIYSILTIGNPTLAMMTKECFLLDSIQLKTFWDRQNPAMLNVSELPEVVRKKFLILTGEGEKTKKKVIVQTQSPDGRAKNFFNFDSPDADGDGDGTVSLESTAIYKDVVLTLALKKKWSDLAMHGLFLNDGESPNHNFSISFK